MFSHAYVFSYLSIAPAGNLEMRLPGVKKRCSMLSCSIESRLNAAYFCCVQENKREIGLIENRSMHSVHVAKHLGLRPFNAKARV